ncbi:hypothetical protein USDA257_p03000 (plasmid) [Sinorhizobium fredii USDA 257]|uniref:Uncharacterized protein n=1 Tax=Sinorhizobium fredii (strain USDA 257) TaxID=1185652 RepID=I3XGK9_SINF2|nr:hypothetical protein USDA257_p03000 [Sinorhizobium fredii USDA 257]
MVIDGCVSKTIGDGSSTNTNSHAMEVLPTRSSCQASKQISSMIMAFLGGSFLIAGDGLTTGSIVASASLLSPT